MNTLNITSHILRDAEEKDLLMRITRIIGKRLVYLVDVERWKNNELAEKFGVPQNRLSEYKKHEKYNRAVTQEHFAAFITGGIVTTSELIENVAANEKEREFIEQFKLNEDAAARKEYFELKKLGYDPVKVMADFRKSVTQK